MGGVTGGIIIIGESLRGTTTIGGGGLFTIGGLVGGMFSIDGFTGGEPMTGLGAEGWVCTTGGFLGGIVPGRGF